MATMTLVETARQRRLDALASLGSAKRTRYEEGLVSLFDNAFDDETVRVSRNNVIAFRSGRKGLAANQVRIAA